MLFHVHVDEDIRLMKWTAVRCVHECTKSEQRHFVLLLLFLLFLRRFFFLFSFLIYGNTHWNVLYNIRDATNYCWAAVLLLFYGFYRITKCVLFTAQNESQLKIIILLHFAAFYMHLPNELCGYFFVLFIICRLLRWRLNFFFSPLRSVCACACRNL